MKAVLIFLCLLLSTQMAGANEPYDNFRLALIGYLRAFETLSVSDDSALNAQLVRKAGFDLQQSWDKAKSYVEETDPELGEYLNPRVRFLVLATYMIQYDPELDRTLPLGSSSYTDAWKQGYADAYKQTPQSYISDLTKRLQGVHPDEKFQLKNGLLYSKHVMFMADAISVSLLETIQATMGKPVLQQQIDAILEPKSQAD